MKRLLIALLFVIPLSSMQAQESSSPDLSLGCDVNSRYVWRGLSFCDAPSIQPYLALTAGGFSAMVWGSYATSKNYAEVDLFLSYTVKNFTIGFSDFFNEDETNFKLYEYSDWDKTTTAHLGESYLNYVLPVESFPLVITASMLVYGYDLDVNGKNNYSTYFELKYPFTFKEYSLYGTLGAVPEEGFYADKGGLVNVSLGVSKNIEITDKFSVPLNTALTYNPNANDIFFVVGISF